MAASDGFDGLFIDNCIQHSYSPSAQAAFRDWIGKRYSAEDQKDLLGFESSADVRLHHEGDIIQWAFTFKEWIPWLEAKYPAADRPLYFNTFGPLDATAVNAAPGVLSHYSIPFKLGFQNGFSVAMLAYDKGGPDSTALQHAEAAAHGGVCVLHKPHVRGPHHDIQRRYQKFFDQHQDWYRDYESAAQGGALRETFPFGKVGEAKFYLELDRRFGLKRYRWRNPVVQELHKTFAGPAGILDPDQGEDIRVALYRHPDRGDLVLHLVNYRVPMQGHGPARGLKPQENLAITVPLPRGDRSPRVKAASPNEPDFEIGDLTVQDAPLTFSLPVLRDYALVRISR